MEPNGDGKPGGRIVKLAVVQFTCSVDVAFNVKHAEDKVKEASQLGANVILLQELFSSRYFPIDQADRTSLAISQNEPNFIYRFQMLAKELKVVLPISFFEQCNNVFYNSVVMIDADGKDLGTYRKSHIPAGPGYQEKFYFTPGQTGFKVFNTKFAKIGVGICWDQWFPECARSMVLNGAEMLLYPTAIGSEPHNTGHNSEPHWRRCMQGHAAANMVPVAAANRVGTEHSSSSNSDHKITFYGSSFICDHFGEVIIRAGDTSDDVIVAELDLEVVKRDRVGWGLFRDRRPDLYGAITTFDGQEQVHRAGS